MVTVKLFSYGEMRRGDGVEVVVFGWGHHLLQSATHLYKEMIIPAFGEFLTPCSPSFVEDIVHGIEVAVLGSAVLSVLRLVTLDGLIVE